MLSSLLSCQVIRFFDVVIFFALPCPFPVSFILEKLYLSLVQLWMSTCHRYLSRGAPDEAL